MFHCFFCSILRSHLGGKRRAFPGPFETMTAGARPCNCVTAGVRNGNYGVVEGRSDVSDPIQNILALFLFPRRASIPCHDSSRLLFALADDGPARSLSSAGVGVCALSANRQTPAMAQPTVASEIHQALDVHGNFGAQIAFDFIMGVDDLSDGVDLGFRENIALGIKVDTRLLQNLLRRRPADTVNIGQSDLYAFILR